MISMILGICLDTDQNGEAIPSHLCKPPSNQIVAGFQVNLNYSVTRENIYSLIVTTAILMFCLLTAKPI